MYLTDESAHQQRSDSARPMPRSTLAHNRCTEPAACGTRCPLNYDNVTVCLGEFKPLLKAFFEDAPFRRPRRFVIF